jgi:hypothetical protein
MDQEIEIIPIAIQLKNYNQHIAELVEHLLDLDDKLNATHQSSEA